RLHLAQTRRYRVGSAADQPSQKRGASLIDAPAQIAYWCSLLLRLLVRVRQLVLVVHKILVVILKTGLSQMQVAILAFIGTTQHRLAFQTIVFGLAFITQFSAHIFTSSLFKLDVSQISINTLQKTSCATFLHKKQ